MIASLIRFAFISFLFSSAAVFSADNVSISTETSASQAASQPTANTQLPEWFYRELTSIRKDVSVLDATGASKEQIQELKERIGKVEVRLEETQLRVDGKLSEQSGRIGDIADSNSFSLELFSILAGALGLAIVGLSWFFSSSAKREAVSSAKEEAQIKLNEWVQKKEAEITESFDAKLNDLSERYEKQLEVVRDDVKEQDAISIFNKGALLNQLGRFEEAIEVYDELLEKFQHSKEVGVQEQVKKSLVNKGDALGKLNRLEEKIAVFSEVFNRFKDNKDHSTQELVARVLLDKGINLGQLNRPEEELAAYEEVFERFKDSKESVIVEQVAKALYNKGRLLGELKPLEEAEAIVVYEEMFERFKGRSEIAIQEIVVNALVNKAELVLATYDKEEAKKSIHDAIIFMKEGYKEHRAVMEVLSFIVEESTVNDVLSKVEAIPDKEEIDWSFDEIRPVIENLESPRKEQVEAFARYFEDHHNKVKLKEELDQISKL